MCCTSILKLNPDIGKTLLFVNYANNELIAIKYERVKPMQKINGRRKNFFSSSSSKGIHDKGQDQQAPHHTDVHLSTGLRHTEVQFSDEIHHCGGHRKIHQPLEFRKIMQS